MRTGRHEKQHRDRQHRVGARSQKCDAARFDLSSSVAGLMPRIFFWFRPDSGPDVEQHDGAQPGTDADDCIASA